MGLCVFVYNALSRWAGRVKMSRNVVTVSIGAMAILAGISMSLVPNLGDFAQLVMVILTFGGLVVCAISYGQAHKDDWRELNRQRAEFNQANEVLSELKSMNKSISDLAEEIRTDRKNRE